VLLLLIGLALPCFAKEATVGARVRFSYEDGLWEPQASPDLPNLALTRVKNGEGNFSVMVLPEKEVEGGMSSPESRALFVGGLVNGKTQVSDIRPITIFDRKGFEFIGQRDLAGTVHHMRLVLLVDDGDVIVLISGAREKNPMSVPLIARIWESVSLLKRR
jgi:hypothetical protein